MKNYKEVKFILSEIEPTVAMDEILTEGDLPNLNQILKEQESWLAPRAVCAISRFNTEHSKSILYELVNDPRMEIRVALAACARTLPLDVSEKIISKLIEDKEIGVRKFAFQSVLPNASPELIKQLKKVYNKEKEPFLKEVLSKKIAEFEMG